MTPRRSAPVLVLGELDGVHRGHRRLLRVGVAMAHRARRRCDAVVFDVEARERVLTEPGERARRVLAEGVSLCRVLGVQRDGVDADRLAERILGASDPAVVVMACAPAALDDHRYPDLIAAFRNRGIEVVEVERVHDRAGIVSSGRIRSALDRGDVAGAASLIGAAYCITGEVCHGQQLGRTIGFPTANLEPPPRRVLPADGVYAAEVVLPGGARVDAAVNVGVRPTVETAGRTLVEAHLLDVDVDLYGRHIAISFVARIRGERRFDGLDALTAQLHHDVEVARTLLAAAREAGTRP
jgi:riboflavin kinase/FMN adenylyltransferase